jgi:DNA-binding response OmpR family regulator
MRPDLVLLDLGLPDLSGYEVAARLRGAGVDNVVALTGYGDAEARARSRTAGCALHLTKPVDVERLRALLLS